jgi:hypothetical protein
MLSLPRCYQQHFDIHTLCATRFSTSAFSYQSSNGTAEENRHLKQENATLLQVRAYASVYTIPVSLYLRSLQNSASYEMFPHLIMFCPSYSHSTHFLHRQTVYSEQKRRYAAELQNAAVNKHASSTVGILQGRLASANTER